MYILFSFLLFLRENLYHLLKGNVTEMFKSILAGELSVGGARGTRTVSSKECVVIIVIF